MHGILARFPFLAEAAHRFPQTNRKSSNGFQALRRALRQTSVAFAPYFRKKQFRVAENAGKRIVQFMPQHFAEFPAVQFSISDFFSQGNSSRRLEKTFRSGRSVGITLGLAQTPLDQSKRREDFLNQ